MKNSHVQGYMYMDLIVDSDYGFNTKRTDTEWNKIE